MRNQTTVHKSWQRKAPIVGWKCRNGVSFDNKIIIPGGVSKRATEYLQEYITVNQPNVASSVNDANDYNAESRTEVSWQKPCAGFYKVNVDAAWNKDSLKGSVGVVAGNCSGEFKAAAMDQILYYASAMVGEAMALRHGLLLGINLGLSSVFFESDSQSVINMFNGLSEVSQDVQVILHNILSLGRRFLRASFSFVSRSSDTMAHVIASRSLGGTGYGLWTESPPFWLLGPLLMDETSS